MTPNQLTPDTLAEIIAAVRLQRDRLDAYSDDRVYEDIDALLAQPAEARRIRHQLNKSCLHLAQAVSELNRLAALKRGEDPDADRAELAAGEAARA